MTRPAGTCHSERSEESDPAGNEQKIFVSNAG